MKILLVNKYLYPRGGDCIYTLHLASRLRAEGHEVRFFAMSHPDNIPDEGSGYFPREVDFSSTAWRDKLRAAARVLWGTGVKKGYVRLLDAFRPDVVHLNNIHSQLSPIVAKLAYRRGIKVRWTLHDYKLICPSYNCLCHGKPCEACFRYKWQVVARRCMKNSLPVSLLAYAEAIRWNRRKLVAWTDEFICPSGFMAEKMRQAGFPKEKMRVEPNRVGEEQLAYIRHTPAPTREPAYAYVGRLSQEKGIEALLSVAATLPYTLYIIGDGALREKLMRQYVTSKQLVFVGQMAWQEVLDLLRRVRFSVVPSVCYENCPLSVLESLACGTPVLGRRIGGIPELLESDARSRLFTDDAQMAERIEEMIQSNEQ
ncbi:MAG: glycosyltransferase [Prevotellaceae bacterium]|jgi:glycosyltransferase involved in cell wall biosynthesis|nr:glycosyltransferase [Prevotellaceae bacterium]